MLKHFFSGLLRSEGLAKYAANGFWVVLDQVVRMFLGFFVGVSVARHLGPDQFGIFSFVGAMVAIASALSRLGLDGVLVRELVGSEKKSETMSSAFWLLNISAVICLCTFWCLSLLIDGVRNYREYFFLASGVIAFQSFSVVDYFFQSIVKSKLAVVCRVASLAISSALMVFGVVESFGVLYFFSIVFLEKLLLAAFYFLAGRISDAPKYFRGFSLVTSRKLLQHSWPMVVTALAVTLYMRIDQVMIREMLGDREVGLYSAAARVYEAWVVVPYLISVSLLPAIIKAKELGVEVYHRRLVYLFRFLFYLNLCVAFISVFFGGELIVLAFGEAYVDSKSVFSLMMLAAVFSALGSGNARYLIAEKMEKKIATRTFVAASANIILNFILIPRMGIEGAAVATIVALLIGNLLVDHFDPALKPLVRVRMRAIFFK